MPVLAALEKSAGGRAYELSKKLNANPISIMAAIDHLVSLGLLEENPGHGHPLRPEFLLSSLGASLAPKAQEILNYGSRQGVLPLLRKRWTLPALTVIDKAYSFSQIRNRLMPVTDRALSLCLKDMDVAHLIKRKLKKGCWPPKALYIPRPHLEEIRVPLMQMTQNQPA